MIWHVKDSDIFCLAISSQLRKHMTHCMFHKKVISDVATWHLPPKHNRRIYTRPPKLSGMSGLVKCNQLHDFIQHKSYYMSSLLETQQRSLSQCFSERPGTGTQQVCRRGRTHAELVRRQGRFIGSEPPAPCPLDFRTVYKSYIIIPSMYDYILQRIYNILICQKPTLPTFVWSR